MSKMQTLYIDIGAQRIQTWISKPVKLKYVKGGSIRLSEETDDNKIARWLNNEHITDFVVAKEAGNIDGVVVLKGSSSEIATRRADEVAYKLLLYLNERLPGIEWAGWRCSASSFLDAYNRGEQKKVDKRYSLEPSTMEFAGFSLCEGCKAEPAVRSIGHVQENLGPDCASRFGNSEMDDERREKEVNPQWKSYPGDWLESDRGWPQDFTELAGRVGNVANKNKIRNHVATVCADGNRVGALFKELSNYPALADFKLEAIRLLDETTRKAVQDAALEVQQEDIVILPHYIGGDDILISVTADEAWNFVVAMIEKFENLKEEYRKILEPVNVKEIDGKSMAKLRKSIDNISLGVGLVFSHASYPFYECRQKAEEALSYAKKEYKGERSAICWMDLTEGGGESKYTKDRHVIAFEDAEAQLKGNCKLPEVISELTSSAQHNLRNQMIAWMQEHHKETKESSSEWLKECSDYLEKWVDRTQVEKIDIDINTLEADLHRARWWPNNSDNKEKSAS